MTSTLPTRSQEDPFPGELLCLGGGGDLERGIKACGWFANTHTHTHTRTHARTRVWGTVPAVASAPQPSGDDSAGRDDVMIRMVVEEQVMMI